MRKSERLGMRVEPSDKERWERLAAKSGMSLSEWITMWANWAADLEERLDKDR